MDFGKVNNVDNINFSMPDDHRDNRALFAKLCKPQKPQIYIGCPAWGEKSFVGKIYPPKTKVGDFIHHYSKSFATIEFNSTYYALPKQETIHKWCEKIVDCFKVCPKVPYQVSHELELVKAEAATHDFITNIKHWGEHLGVAFMVLPPHFGVQKSQILCEYIKQFPKDTPLAIEFRDPGWFTLNEETRKVFSSLEENNISTVITDVAGRRDCLHQRVTTSKVLVRFVGNNLHASDYHRLDAWADKLQVWIANGIEEIHFFIHEPKAILAIDAAIYFISQIENKLPQLYIKKPQIIKTDIQQTFF